MSKYQSSSQFLEAYGYEAGDGYYVKTWIDTQERPTRTLIPAQEWVGLSVEDFEKKAKKRGWIEDGGTQGIDLAKTAQSNSINRYVTPIDAQEYVEKSVTPYPCKHCHQMPVVELWGDLRHSVVCLNPHCSHWIGTLEFWGTDREQAIASWNKANLLGQQLNLCKHCGNKEPLLTTRSDQFYIIKCGSKGCFNQVQCAYQSSEKVIDAWNKENPFRLVPTTKPDPAYKKKFNEVQAELDLLNAREAVVQSAKALVQSAKDQSRILNFSQLQTVVKILEELKEIERG